jgi:hypothetical protein
MEQSPRVALQALVKRNNGMDSTSSESTRMTWMRGAERGLLRRRRHTPAHHLEGLKPPET